MNEAISDRHVPSSRIALSRPPAPLGVVQPTRDPMDRVLRMGRRAGVGLAVALLVAFVGQTAASAGTIEATLWGLGRWTGDVVGYVDRRLNSEFEVTLEEEKKPDPVVPKEEPKIEPKEEAPKPVAAPLAPTPPPQPIPKAAEASRVLTSNEPVLDLTDKNTIINGNNDEASHGAVARDGKGNEGADTKNASPQGNTTANVPLPPPQAPPPGPPPPDRSRAASLASKDGWSWCPFPAEADAAQIDEAVVTLQVIVAPDGKPRRVSVVADPSGNGFGREATRCAMRVRYNTGLDRAGNPIEGTVTFNVRFSR